MADPLTTFTGVSSGMDWRSLVEQLMTLERRPADKLQATVDANTKRKEALNAFQTQVQALKDVADRLAGTNATGTSPFRSFMATTTGGTEAGRAVTYATVGESAIPGTYGVQVTALARTHKLTGTAGVAPTWTAPADGATRTLTLARPGAEGTPFASIPVAAGDTLAAVRDKINALNTGATATGVLASIVNVSATEQRLVLTASGSGAAARFVVGDDGTSGLAAQLGLDAASHAANPSLRQEGQDAAFSVDGIPMTRATNTVGDVLPGVTLTLAAEGSSTVSVTRQTAAATDGVKAFVDAYNAIQKTIATSTRDTKATLYGDSLLRTMRGSLASVVVTAAPAADAENGVAGVASDLTTLASLGISLQKDGTMTLDAGKLTPLVEGRLPDVQALLAHKMQALSDYADGLAKPLTGTIDAREAALDTQSARLTARIGDIDARLEKRRAALVAQYAKFEASLGRLKALGDQMSAQFSGLTKSSDS